MGIILKVTAAVLVVMGIALLFGLTPVQITDDLMNFITPHDSIREKARNVRGNKNRHGLYRKLISIKGALESTGKTKQFAAVMCVSVIAFALGIIVSVFIGNLFLMPVLAAAFALVPFLYISNMIASYENHIKEEIETTVSIITTSYERCDDIVSAVRENIGYIKPPLQNVFMAFEGEATSINANTQRALVNLREKVDNEIFREWVDTLILCQDDRTLKDTLQPVVKKFADVRIVNSELKTMLASVRNEYLVMVGLVVGNVPLLYLLNKDWFHTLLYTVPGKLVCGICGTVILITAILMKKFTRPVEYKR